MSPAIWWWLNPRWTSLVRIVIPANNYSTPAAPASQTFCLLGRGGESNFAEFSKLAKLVKWEGKLYDPLQWAAAAVVGGGGGEKQTWNKDKIYLSLLNCCKISVGTPLMVSSRSLSEVRATIIQQFPCLMINIMLDIPSININAPFQVLWTKWPNLTAQKIL